MEEKLRSLKENLTRRLDSPKTVCLWFSGGSDSRLLLEVMCSTRKPFGIICQDDGLSREQKLLIDAVILEKNLQVFSYPPMSYLMIGDGENLSLAAAYPLNRRGTCLPVVRDIVKGEKCAFDLEMDVSLKTSAPVEFDCHILGTRSSDRHYSYGSSAITEKDLWFTGGKRFYAPLFDWSKKEVIAALKTFGVDYAEPTDELDSGNLAACSNCLREANPFCPKTNSHIEPVEWNRAENLKTFRKALNLTENL